MKRRIYVVDDQVAVMETAVLILRGIESQWEVEGFSDPFVALEAIKAKPPDLVLSDQLMPGMQGSQLLEEIRHIAPGAIRIIMSGYVSLNRLTLITSAHQYIAKPFDIGRLRGVLRRSFAAQERIRNCGLQTVASSLRSIPSLPQVHQTLLQELNDNTTAGSVIAKTLAEDAGLSIKVLQLANSPLFGRGNLITNPTEAVMCLGTEMIAAIVLSQCLLRHYEPMSHPEFDAKRVWTHCWETAYISQVLCREKKLSRKMAEEAFLAGLLHEAGRYILIDNFPDKYAAACAKARQEKTPLRLHLVEEFRSSPGQLTAYLMELWGMPSEVVVALSLLDNPQQEPGGVFSLASAIYLADHLASRATPADDFPQEPWNMDYVRSIGCEADLAEWEKPSFPPKSARI